MSTDFDAVVAGQAIYDKRTLAIYDLLVLGLSNRWIWRCPTPIQLDHYNKNLSANHLDVGVGTGYFLDKCRFPVDMPRVALMDLNCNSLESSARRIVRYKPQTYVRNVLEPIPFEAEKFDSVSMNYLLHCLPGSLESEERRLRSSQSSDEPGRSSLRRDIAARRRRAKLGRETVDGGL